MKKDCLEKNQNPSPIMISVTKAPKEMKKGSLGKKITRF